MSKALDCVIRLEVEWAKALEIREALQGQIQVLSEQNERLNAQLRHQVAMNETLAERNRNLETINALLGGDQAKKKKIKSRINELIRDVACCIAQLENG